MIAMKLLPVVALAALGLLAALWAFQTYGIYRFPDAVDTPQSAGLPRVRVAGWTAADGTPVSAWVASPTGDMPVILSFHGNFSRIGPSAARLQPLLDRGYGLAMLQYRGAGGAPGRPTEKRLTGDALAMYDRLDDLMGQHIGPERRVIHGFSLGSGLAVALGAARPSRAVIAEAGFASLTDFFANRYFGVPFQYLMWRERFDSHRLAPGLKAPLLVAIGANDRSIPRSSAERLFRAAPEPKRLIVYPEATHADLGQHGFFDDLHAFVQSPP